MDLSGLKFTSSSTYTIVEEIGRGGMGIVLLAEKNSEGVADLVALKTIRTKSTDHETRLKQEANIATGLRHENIVKTYGLEAIPYSQLPADFLQEFDKLSYEEAKRHAIPRHSGPGGRLVDARTRLRLSPQAASEQKILLMVMDYIEGTDVRTFQNEHYKRDLLLPVPLAGFIVSRIARSLAYAHQSIIHRDISPENLLLNLQGVVKLSDFGVAVDHNEEGMIGKVSYMSPEQIGGEVVDLRTDIYSLGLVLYVLLTGVPLQKVPLRMPPEDRVEYARRLLDRPVLAPSKVRVDVPEAISDICMKMLARDREKRFPRAEAVARDLEQKYLYAKGFGPTNNSLQSYLEIFDGQFKEITPEQLQQLPFLHGELKRPIAHAFYTSEGKAFLDEVRNR
ncbi:MAG TPA: serine/threonine-protein kinase [Planctomycetota bacterium]|nr:serine/threonine-protein kinase [Planctomycetota bacterium]